MGPTMAQQSTSPIAIARGSDQFALSYHKLSRSANARVIIFIELVIMIKESFLQVFQIIALSSVVGISILISQKAAI